MKQLFFAFSVLFLVQSCTSGKSDQQVAATQSQSAESVSPNRLLTLEIEGMVCEKGCGSSIRKELKSTGGVASCAFDFKEERKANVATIEFDKDKISADKIISIVSSMNEKQFTVTKSETTALEEKANVQETVNDENHAEASKINVSESNFEMPNLLTLFSKLILRN